MPSHVPWRIRIVLWMNSIFSVYVGQPLEVLKTQVAANRNQTLATACSKIYARGGLLGFWQGLYPWAWIEAATKGGVLLLAQSEVQSVATNGFGASVQIAGAAGGICGGVAQGKYPMHDFHCESHWFLNI